MSLRASLALVLATPVAFANCTGPVESPTGPSSIVAPSTHIEQAIREAVTSPVGSWKGDMEIQESDDAHTFKVELTFAEVASGVYQAVLDGGTIQLAEQEPGFFIASMLTGETTPDGCRGLPPQPVFYAGGATLQFKGSLLISIGGWSDDCSAEAVSFTLKNK